MNRSSIQLSPLTPTIGVEISGIDLNATTDSATLDAVYQALVEHQVIFFRDQSITSANHIRFAESFGQLDKPHPVYAHVDGFDRIVLLQNDVGNPPDTDVWHTDLTFKDNPPFASILVAREVPASGGDTLWTNMVAAYDALPDGMKTMLATLRAVHDMGDFRNDYTVGEDNGTRLMAAEQRFGCAIHDVVKVHPVSGLKYLYVNESFTVHIVGESASSSRRLLNYLLDHINRPEFQCRFRWREGSIAMWDNRCTQHYAVSDYLPAKRCMHRITVVNDGRVANDRSTAA